MRKLQATADVIVPFCIIKKDGTQGTVAGGVTLASLSSKIIGPNGLAVSGYTEATFTEPNADGSFVAKFPSNAAVKAFTQADQANPYHITFDSSVADYEPTLPIPIYIVSKYPWELASQSTSDNILSESQSHPSLAEIEASVVLAKEATLNNGTYGLAELRAMILTRLASKAYVTGIGPTSAVVTNGTIISGDISSIQTRNQQYLIVQETGLFIADFEWTGLSVKETKIRFIGHLTFGTGVTNHKVELKIWNYTTSAWDDVLSSNKDIPSSEVDYIKDFTVPGNINDYYSGSAPNMTMKLRIEHQQNTTPDLQHHLWINSFVIGEQEIEYSAPDTIGINAIREAVYDPVYGLSVIQGLISLLQVDLGDPSIDATTIYAKILALQAAVAALGNGTGANQVTIKAQLADLTPIPDVSIQVFNSDQTVLICAGVTNVAGERVFALNNEVYKVRLYKAGYTFTVPETITVAGNGTFTLNGTVVQIGQPTSVSTCRVYEWCFMADDSTPKTAITAKANIINLPYNYNTKLHAGDVINGTYDPASGKVYWDIVYGATVQFKIAEMGLETTKTVPSISNKRLSDIT